MFHDSLDAFSKITLTQVSAFLIPFLIAIYVDLKAHKKGKQVTIRDATIWSCVWIVCAMAFGGYLYLSQGRSAVSGYLTGYVMEKALAIDNLFAFFLIFRSFGLATPRFQPFQHLILYWGILGAIVFRVIFLGMGALILELHPSVLIVFAAIELWTVYRMWRSEDDAEEVDYSRHWSVNLVKRFVKVNPSIESRRMFSKGATPLFLCLVCIEVCDIIFAFDSMPVIVAVVKDPYLMITSSLWAAAGLRSLYFLLIAAQNKFWALEKAVMVLLVFVSAKLVGNAFQMHIRNEYSLIVVAIILGAGVLWSLARPKPSGP